MRRRVVVLIGLAVLIPVAVVTVGVLALAIAYLGHPEELGRPSVDTTLEETLVLNSDRPVAVRALVVKVDPAGVTLQHVGLGISGWPSAGSVADGSFWASVIDPLTGQAVTVTAVSPGAGVSRDLTDACGTRSCRMTFVLVARLLPPYPGTDVTFYLRAILGVENLRPPDLPTPLPSHLSIEVDPALSFQGRPSTLTAHATGAVHLTGSSPGKSAHLLLKIPAAALRGPLLFPVIGHLIVRPQTATGSDTTLIDVTIGGPHGQEHANLDLTVVDYEWLSACRPGVDCVVPIDVTPHLRELNSSSAAPTSWAEGTWSMEARLEILDATENLPDVQLTLEPVAP